jgi:hypothetical protein
MDKFKKLTLSALLLLSVGTLAGCGGGGADVRATTVSKGQELQDLKKAFDSGAISKKEYERLRSEVIRRDN